MSSLLTQGGRTEVLKRHAEPNLNLTTDTPNKLTYSYTTPDNKTPNDVTAQQYNKWVGKPGGGGGITDLRQQMMTNQVLLSDVTTHERRTLEYPTTTIKKKVDGFRHDMRLWHEQGMELLKVQQEKTKYATAAVLPIPVFVQEYGLSVSAVEMESLIKRYCTVDNNNDRAFNEVVMGLVTLKDNPRQLAKLCEEAKKVTDANLNAEFVRSTKRLYDMSLTEPVNVASVMRLLQQTDGQLRDYKWDVTQKLEQRRVAMDEDDNIPHAEEITDAMLATHDKIHKLHLQRLDTLSNSGLGESFLKEFDEVCKNLGELCEHMSAVDVTMLDKVQKDLNTVDVTKKVDKSKRSDLDLQFAKRQQERYQEIGDLNKKQDALWSEIDKLLDQITRYGVERDSIIKDQIADKTNLDELIAKSETLQLICDKHADNLEQIQKHLEAEFNTIKKAEKFIEEVNQNMRKVIQSGREATSQELHNERVEFSKSFREYLFCVSDLVASKERLLEDMEGQMEDLSWHIQHAKGMLDPQLKRYQEERREVEGRYRSVSTKVDTLKEIMGSITKEFEMTEKELMDVGVLTVSPLVEAHERMTSTAETFNTSKSELKHKEIKKLETLQEDTQRIAEMAKRVKSARLPGTQLMLASSSTSSSTPMKVRPESAQPVRSGSFRNMSLNNQGPSPISTTTTTTSSISNTTGPVVGMVRKGSLNSIKKAAAAATESTTKQSSSAAPPSSPGSTE